MADKKLFKSKTFWFSFLTGLVIALLPLFPVLTPVKDWMAGNSAVVGTVWTVLALIIRILTKDKITLVD